MLEIILSRMPVKEISALNDLNFYHIILAPEEPFYKRFLQFPKVTQTSI